ncbi:MAG TPA: tetratricopeptide repeat protein [Rugosimonospora sp.]|nr:tetratricopeptide repeat protein [Rugosimonospora sp.]
MSVDVSKHLDRAKRHLEKNKLEDAAEAYESVLSEMPGHPEALQALGDLYMRLSQTDRAIKYNNMLFDHFFETHEENKALAVFTRALKGIQQPPERLARYALLLQKQNRPNEAIEQYSFASELFLAHRNEEAALDCLERVAQLDPDNSARQIAIAELAERLGKSAIAGRGLLRAGQLAEASGDQEAGLNMMMRAHKLAPKERGPALLCAQALLRRKDAAAAMRMLEPFARGEKDQTFLRTLGEALTFTGALDRARDILERLPADQPETINRIFELADRYLATHQDAEAVALLQKLLKKTGAAQRESDFAAKLDLLVDSHAGSIALAEFCAAAYAQLNRETKYFDALVRLFDVHIAAGDMQHASETFEMLVDIDPYDARNQKRLSQIQAHADPAFLARMRSRLGQTATQAAETPPEGGSLPAPEEQAAPPTLEDLMVQAEIFLQYSLQSKAVDRLQRITEFFPGEEKHNQRLRNLYQLANWWPEGAAEPQAPSAERAAKPAPSAADSDTMRDLAKISEIGRSLFRLPTARAILSSGINEIGTHLRVTRCIAVIGPTGKPPELASEFCASNVEPASGAMLVRLFSQLDRAAPDALGGLPLDAAAAPVLRELGLQTVLGVALMDRERQRQAGMVVAGYAFPHQWRPHETYFLQAVGDQILLGVNHTRLRTLARTVGVADEKTGLLARSSYQECLMAEAHRAKSNGIPLALALVQIDGGPEVLRQQGEIQLERYVEQLARAFQALIRQTDLAIKYTAWTIAFILPDTGLAGAQILAEKLRKAATQIAPPWNGSVLSFSASVAEAVARPDYDSEDIVTELVNRAEAGLTEAHGRGGDVVIASRLRGR